MKKELNQANITDTTNIADRFAFLIMGIMTSGINRTFETVDTDALHILIG